MEPSVEIPYSLRRQANEARHGNGGDRCLLCGKPTEASRAHVVVLDESCGRVADPMTPADRNGGEFLIGPDCWRKNPQLHPYEIKAGGMSYRDLPSDADDETFPPAKAAMIVKVWYGGLVADFFVGRELTSDLIYSLVPAPPSADPCGPICPLYRLYDFPRGTTHNLDTDGRDIHRPGEWYGWLLDLAREYGWGLASDAPEAEGQGVEV